MQRLVRKGVPIKTPTYTVDGHLVWGATARIVQSLLERLGRLAARRRSCWPQTSFSIGTLTRLPHSVHEPS